MWVVRKRGLYVIFTTLNNRFVVLFSELKAFLLTKSDHPFFDNFGGDNEKVGPSRKWMKA